MLNIDYSQHNSALMLGRSQSEWLRLTGSTGRVFLGKCDNSAALGPDFKELMKLG